MKKDELIGTRLGNFEVIRRIASGASGIVYEARQLNMGGRTVAVKVLDLVAARSEHEKWKRDFEKEVATIARLRHPNILPVFDAGEEDGRPYLAMQYVAGGSLHQHLEAYRKKGEAVPWDEIVHIVRQVGDGLDHAHAEGVVHRDIKPLNILMDEQLQCYVADFGIAKLLDPTGTQTAGIKGTPWYMSPEQCEGAPPDGRSDLYSLGIMLFEMATGTVPFQAPTTTAVLIQHIRETPRFPAEMPRPLSPAVRDVILKSIEKKAERRFQSGKELTEALVSALGGHDPAGDDDGPSTRPIHALRGTDTPRRKTPVFALSILGGVGILAIIAVLTSSYIWSSNPPEDEDRAQATVPRSSEAVPVETPEARQEDAPPPREETRTLSPPPSTPRPPWRLAREDLSLEVLWRLTGNPNLDGRLGPFRDEVIRALKKEKLGRVVSRTATSSTPSFHDDDGSVFNVSRKLADDAVDGILEVALSWQAGVPGPDGYWQPRMVATTVLVTRDDPRPRSAATVEFTPDDPVRDVIGGLLPALEPRRLGESLSEAVEEWVADITRRGRGVQVVWETRGTPPGVAALQAAVRGAPGAVEDSVRLARAQVRGTDRLRFILTLRIQGSIEAFMGWMEKQEVVPFQESGPLHQVERMGHLIFRRDRP